MLYFIAEDHYYYTEEQIKNIEEKWKREIVIFPNIEDVKNNITRGSEVAFLAPYPPSSLDVKFKSSAIFETVDLENYYNPFTKEQVDLNIDKDKILSEKLGIKITNSPFTFDDYGSGQKLIDEANKIELRFLFDLKPKGFFIVGIPGTGKSFFAKCFAGQTGRKLVEFNISKIKEFPEPAKKIEMILSYIKNTPGKYLLWIDEIEKQFVDDSTTDLLGVFLTELNEFQSSVSNVFFIATANNIDRISTKFPELLRPGGRFDKLIFLLPSSDDDTTSIFKIYVDEKQKHFRRELLISSFLKALFPGNICIADGTRLDDIANYIKKEGKTATLLKIKNKIKPYVDLYTGVKPNNDGIEDSDFLNTLKLYEKKIISKEEIYRRIIEILRGIIEKEISNSYAIKILVADIIKRFGFNFPIDEAKAQINQKYREESVEKSRFPYTPSEISNILNVIYIEYYLSSTENKTAIEGVIAKNIEDNIPIQKQFKQGITTMTVQAENFLRI